MDGWIGLSIVVLKSDSMSETVWEKQKQTAVGGLAGLITVSELTVESAPHRRARITRPAPPLC